MQKKQAQKNLQLPGRQQQPDVKKLHGPEKVGVGKQSSTIKDRKAWAGVTLLGDDPENMEWEAEWYRAES
jgi:hypothetical protein